jgi:hypothetical protein
MGRVTAVLDDPPGPFSLSPKHSGNSSVAVKRRRGWSDYVSNMELGNSPGRPHGGHGEVAREEGINRHRPRNVEVEKQHAGRSTWHLSAAGSNCLHSTVSITLPPGEGGGRDGQSDERDGCVPIGVIPFDAMWSEWEPAEGRWMIGLCRNDGMGWTTPSAWGQGEQGCNRATKRRKNFPTQQACRRADHAHK